MAADFRHIFPGIAFGRAVDKDHRLVDFALPVVHPAVQAAVAFGLLHLFAGNRPENPVRHLQRLRAGDAHHPDSARRDRRRDGGDGILRKCVHAKASPFPSVYNRIDIYIITKNPASEKPAAARNAKRGARICAPLRRGFRILLFKPPLAAGGPCSGAPCSTAPGRGSGRLSRTARSQSGGRGQRFWGCGFPG